MTASETIETGGAAQQGTPGQAGAPMPRPGILSIDAYVPGKDKAAPGVKVHKLSSNETPLGPSPQVLEAIREASTHLEAYPDGSSAALRAAIAKTYGLDAERIVCSNGSDELLSLLAQIYLQADDEAIFTEHGFLVYRIATLSAGGRPVMVPETDETADVDAILGAVTERTRLVYLANPNNPTGTYLPFSEIRRLHGGLRSDIVLVLDAAYAEYVRRNDYEAGTELVGSSDNVVMTRTFSKIHGLASLRIGWLYGPAAIVDAINRVRGPFNVNALAIAAGAAAITDRAHVERAVAHNDEWLERLTARLEALGLRVTPSVANFVLVHFPDGDERHNAALADAYLTERGFILRRVAGYGFPNALRMTVGSAEANEGVIDALEAFMNG